VGAGSLSQGGEWQPPDIPGCPSAGLTEEEARVNIREALELYLAPRDLDLPEDARLVEVTIG